MKNSGILLHNLGQKFLPSRQSWLSSYAYEPSLLKVTSWETVNVLGLRNKNTRLASKNMHYCVLIV